MLAWWPVDHAHRLDGGGRRHGGNRDAIITVTTTVEAGGFYPARHGRIYQPVPVPDWHPVTARAVGSPCTATLGFGVVGP